MRKKSSANLSVDILQYLAHFLYAFLRFDSRSPKQNRLPYRCSVSYSIDASGNLLRKHAAGMFSHAPKTKKPPDGGSFVLVETRGISCALKTCRWHVFFTRFSGSIPTLRKQKNRRMAVFLFWWRRGESNPCPKARPQGLLRAQSFY